MDESGDYWYVVAEGDTMGAIAQRFFPEEHVGIALNLVVHFNDLGSGPYLKVGYEFHIPSGLPKDA